MRIRENRLLRKLCSRKRGVVTEGWKQFASGRAHFVVLTKYRCSDQMNEDEKGEIYHFGRRNEMRVIF